MNVFKKHSCYKKSLFLIVSLRLWDLALRWYFVCLVPGSTLSQKNDTDVAHSNFNAHKPILVIFGTGIAERISYEMVICYSTSHDKLNRLVTAQTPQLFSAKNYWNCLLNVEDIASQSSVIFGIQHDWREQISGVHVSSGSAETLARGGGITYHHLIAYSLATYLQKSIKIG